MNWYEEITHDIENKILSSEDLISNKELASFFIKNNKYKLEEEKIKTSIRYCLLNLEKSGRIKRVARGIYKVNNKNVETESDDKYFMDNNWIESFDDFKKILDIKYENKWSYSYVSLEREIGISEQLSKHAVIYLDIRSKESLTKMRELAKKVGVEIYTTPLNLESVHLFSIYKLLCSKEYKDKDDLYKIYLYISKYTKNIFDLMDYIKYESTSIKEEKERWKIMKVESNKFMTFKNNFQSLIEGENNKWKQI